VNGLHAACAQHPAAATVRLAPGRAASAVQPALQCHAVQPLPSAAYSGAYLVASVDMLPAVRK
jgi:hypothetical protein